MENQEEVHEEIPKPLGENALIAQEYYEQVEEVQHKAIEVMD